MELMLSDPKGDEYIHVHQVSHGKSVSSSFTISLVRIGASGPTSRTVNPVKGSSIMRAWYFRFFWRGKHNAVPFDGNVERIAGANAEPAAKRSGKHDLTLGGNTRLHGKTILPPLACRFKPELTLPHSFSLWSKSGSGSFWAIVDGSRRDWLGRCLRTCGGGLVAFAVAERGALWAGAAERWPARPEGCWLR